MKTLILLFAVALAGCFSSSAHYDVPPGCEACVDPITGPEHNGLQCCDIVANNGLGGVSYGNYACLPPDPHDPSQCLLPDAGTDAAHSDAHSDARTDAR